MPAKTIALGSDHGGFPLKEALKGALRVRGLAVLDVGTNSSEACDYPVFAREAATKVASGEADLGIVVDGAGIGSAMVANKIPGVRAAMAFDVATAKNAREHNGANVLSLGAGYLTETQALAIVDTFLSHDCTVPRHQKRVGMIDALDVGREVPRSSESKMSSSSGSGHDALVSQIVAVLNRNPHLLQTFGCGIKPAGEPSDCSRCGHCAAKKSDEVRSVVSLTRGARVSGALGIGSVPTDIAKLIDHTLLRPDATYQEIDTLCDEARRFGFASVCVNPVHVKRCAERLRGASSVVCTVVGFPLGATPKEVKVLEARRALRDGAREIDMVLNIGALKSGDAKTVLEDVRLVAEAVHEGGAILKVILETALLTDEEKVLACSLCKQARADFVKTSTGFAKGGATEHDVALMAKAVDYKLGVKASGGVKSADDAQKMIRAGAIRIGASVGVKISEEAKTGKKGASDSGAY